MRQAQKEIDQSQDFLGVHAPHALHPKSRVTGQFIFVLASLFEFPIRGEYVLFYPFKSFEVNAMDFSFECMKCLNA